jgi:hypothetical protein
MQRRRDNWGLVERRTEHTLKLNVYASTRLKSQIIGDLVGYMRQLLLVWVFRILRATGGVFEWLKRENTDEMRTKYTAKMKLRRYCFCNASNIPPSLKQGYLSEINEER